MAEEPATTLARLPRRRRRDHLGGGAHPRGRRRARGARPAVRLAPRDVADQLPPPRPRGGRARQADRDRDGGCLRARARGGRGADGPSLGGGVRGRARRRASRRMRAGASPASMTRARRDSGRPLARRPAKARASPASRSAGSRSTTTPRPASSRCRAASRPRSRWSGRRGRRCGRVSRSGSGWPPWCSSWSAGCSRCELLPSATIVLAPRSEPIRPLNLAVQARTDITAVDAANLADPGPANRVRPVDDATA